MDNIKLQGSYKTFLESCEIFQATCSKYKIATTCSTSIQTPLAPPGSITEKVAVRFFTNEKDYNVDKATQNGSVVFDLKSRGITYQGVFLDNTPSSETAEKVTECISNLLTCITHEEIPELSTAIVIDKILGNTVVKLEDQQAVI